jgi:hypothetical protein
MRRIFDFTAGGITPERASVLEAMELGTDKEPPEKIAELVDDAFDAYGELVRARGVFETVTRDEFASIYPGEGSNEAKTPLADIFPQTNQLALFAVTLGGPVSGRIEALFGSNDFALGYVLDTVASEAAEVAADRLEDEYEGYLAEIGAWDSSSAHLRYSPGYCGWHISGQRKLFDRLRPEEIGIELNPSYLMQPLKSISGVVVSGPREIHVFNNNFRFCAACTTLSCRERIKPLLRAAR